MNQSINNAVAEPAFDPVRFKLLVAELLGMQLHPLREALSDMAASTPVHCLAVGAEMLKRLREMPENIAADSRKVVLYACRRSLINMDNSMGNANG